MIGRRTIGRQVGNTLLSIYLPTSIILILRCCNPLSVEKQKRIWQVGTQVGNTLIIIYIYLPVLFSFYDAVIRFFMNNFLIKQYAYPENTSRDLVLRENMKNIIYPISSLIDYLPVVPKNITYNCRTLWAEL